MNLFLSLSSIALGGIRFFKQMKKLWFVFIFFTSEGGSQAK